MIEHNINVTIYFNRQRANSAKRNNFLIAPTCRLIIYKSQEGTFSEIVYYYEKCNFQQLIYVALTRAISIEGLCVIRVRAESLNLWYVPGY